LFLGAHDLGTALFCVGRLLLWADASASIPYYEINPLIDEYADDTDAVVAALKFIAKAFVQIDGDDGIPLDYTECWGVSCLLLTCTAALGFALASSKVVARTVAEAIMNGAEPAVVASQPKLAKIIGDGECILPSDSDLAGIARASVKRLKLRHVA
jgi:hypothetical protein